MMDAQTIRNLLTAGLPGAEIHVLGDDGAHFEARVISPDFAGKNMLQQHRDVYAALGDKMGYDIHALQLRTYTPEQWAAEQGNA